MCENSEKLDKILQLTSEEKILIHGSTIKRARFAVSSEVSVAHNHLVTSQLETATLITVLKDAVKQIEFFLIQFPEHEKPPSHLFDYSLAAFLHRREVDQWTFELYEKLNSPDQINMAKLHVEYNKCIPILIQLIEDLKHKRSFDSLQSNIMLMEELNHFLINLDEENVIHVDKLRKLELEYERLLQIKIHPSPEIKELNRAYEKAHNEYDDIHLIKARQIRYNKRLFNAQMEQIVRREKNKSGAMIDELNELARLCEQEDMVFQQSSKYNFMETANIKAEVELMSKNYDNDLANAEFLVSQAQSSLNYFEEGWNRQLAEMEFMKNECDIYVESIRQRKREAIAKRFAKIWIESARATITERHPKARRLAKKNKNRKMKK